MANEYIARKSELDSIANDLIAKNHATLPLVFPDDFRAMITPLVKPEGNVNITTTSQYNVSDKATAQIVDANLSAENIAKDVVVLGITGTYQGGIIPTGTITIATTGTTAVTNYADAYIDPADVDASVIKKDEVILGITGTYAGIIPTGMSTFTANGLYNISDKEFVNIDVSGEVPTFQAKTVTFTENVSGEVITADPEYDGLSSVTVDVDVDIPIPAFGTLNVTENGTYVPTPGIDGYDEVNVNVEIPEPPTYTTLNVNANGTYTPSSGIDAYDEVIVSVPTPTVPVESAPEFTTNGTKRPTSGYYWDEVLVNVSGEAPVLDTLQITSNGIYTPSSGIDGYDRVEVEVQPTLESKQVAYTANGTFTISPSSASIDGISSVEVTVAVATPTPTINLQDKTVTANGTFTCDPGYDGLGTVTVNIPTFEWNP